MAKFPSDTLQQAQVVSTAWNQIGPTLAFGTLNAAALTADITAGAAVDAEITKLETQLTDKRNQRDATYSAMWDKVKRVRKGVAANFGEDSSQYEMIGGTRLSERKAPRRKATA